MKREGLTSAGGALLALLASQHHNLHMLMLAFGLGGAGMTLMQAYPGIRRVMLLVSAGMVAVNAVSLRRTSMPPTMRAVVGGFTLVTVGLIVWSLLQFGI